MKQIVHIGTRVVFWTSLACLVLLLAGVVWASGRSFEMTDEAYYLLSAIYPDAVQAYVSAQHWTLAPLWQLTGTLVGFRLTGAILLIGSAGLLALGAVRMFALEQDQQPSLLENLPVVASSCVFALLYVATIQPSPSYNLLASGGAYAAAGAVLLAVCSARAWSLFLGCVVAGFFLAVCFVNKPSAGISSALVAMGWIAFLLPGAKKWICLILLPASCVVMVLAMAFMQGPEANVMQSLQNGLALFRQVQTEPILERLIRYGVTLFTAVFQTSVLFAPALILVIGAMIFQRIWLAALALVAFIAIILIKSSFLGGEHNYHLQLEAIYAVMLALALTEFARRLQQPQPSSKMRLRIFVLFFGLVVLPYAVAVGTGNALFTQVIVSLAPWGVLVGLGTVYLQQKDHSTLSILRHGLHVLVLVLITSQILSSYTRDPYHLAAPLTGQNTFAQIGEIGSVRTDPATAQMIADLETIKKTCQIAPNSPYLGLYNTPGLALLLSGIPPVSPWLNNAEQAAFILDLWPAAAKSPSVILAISQRPDGTLYPLPKRLESARMKSVLCGEITLPFSQQVVEIRTVSRP